MKTVFVILAAYFAGTLGSAGALPLFITLSQSEMGSQPMPSSLYAMPITKDLGAYMAYHAEVSKLDTSLPRSTFWPL
jgi:hypothetical protein